MKINQKGSAVWNGDIKGSGRITTGSGVVDAPYSVGTRFQGEKGTNPEELIGAGHASCYTMYLTSVLTKAGAQIEAINTTSTVTLNPNDGKPVVERIHVRTEGRVGGISAEEFQRHAEDAKANCPISRVLSAVPEMTLEATLL